MTKEEEYYSFRNKPRETKKSIDRFESKGNIVFKHDLTLGIPNEYSKCDLIYCEPSWMKGYEIFSERAEKKAIGDYNRYLEVLSQITYLKKPIAMILGKSALKKMNPNYISEVRIKLNGSPETIYGWNIDFAKYNAKGITSFELAKRLSQDYNCVGDMSCGYGNVGKAFKENNKNFVMSDISGKSVYEVAEKIMDYEKFGNS